MSYYEITGGRELTDTEEALIKIVQEEQLRKIQKLKVRLLSSEPGIMPGGMIIEIDVLHNATMQPVLYKDELEIFTNKIVTHQQKQKECI